MKYDNVINEDTHIWVILLSNNKYPITWQISSLKICNGLLSLYNQIVWLDGPSNHMRPRAIRSDVSKLIEYLTWNKLYIKYYGYKIIDLELTRSLNKLYKLYILEYWHRFKLVYYNEVCNLLLVDRKYSQEDEYFIIVKMYTHYI